MEIQLYNIQGFRGDHQYTIDDFVTIINSKHNGVGKTTLYDCLRFLCDVDQVDKEEQEFFLNLNEEEGLFSVTRNGVKHGFALFKGKPPVFYRQVEGEEIERSSENFTTAAQDIGILAINGALLNIFSKEVNLFSGSHSGQNYQLVKEITTHQQTEDMLELLERSININQSDLSNLRAEKRGVDMQVQSMPYFFCVDELESLLADEFYEDLEASLCAAIESLDKLQEVPKFNFNSSLEHFLYLEESLSSIQPTDFVIPNKQALENMDELVEVFNRIQPIMKAEVKAEPLEQLVQLSEGLDNLVESTSVLDLNTKPLEMLDNLLEQLNTLHVEHDLQVSSTLPAMLSNICVKLGEMTTACNQEVRFNRLASEARASVASTRVCCPIREEVYLVEGKCVY